MFSLVRLPLCALAACVAALPAHAQLSINKLWVEFDRSAQPRTDLVIRNDSKDKYFITVKAFEIAQPGTEQETRVETADPEQLGILVTPNRVVLEPGAARAIRLVSLNRDLTRDRVYRVLVTPQIGAITGVSKPKEEESSLAVKLLAAYDVLVIARPNDAQPQVKVTRTDKEIKLENVGNSNVLLSDAILCPPDVKPAIENAACKAVEATRLYAGTNFAIPLASGKEIFTVRERASLREDGKTVQY